MTKQADDDLVIELLSEYQQRLKEGRALPDVESSLSESARGQLERAREVLRVLAHSRPARSDETGRAGDTEIDLPGHATAQGVVDERRVIGRYQLQREIATGGFGVVWLGWDPRLERQVAIKIPRLGPLAHGDMRDRFEREARVSGSLDHPNIVPVYDAGVHEQICYLVSAYCAGPTLSAWIHERTDPVPVRLAAWIVAAIADAVEHAHQRGVLHRDLKPGNVLLEPPAGEPPSIEAQQAGGVPRVTDFGLAKLLTEPGDTQSGTLVGTAPYMSPEQARGKTADFCPATDVYGLGAILYELLTGRAPFMGDTDIDTVRQVIEQLPLPPSRLRGSIPVDLDTICGCCLDKDPRKRYASSQQLADDLRRFLDCRAIRARRTGRLAHAVQWCRRNPLMSTLLGSVATLLVVVAAGASVAALSLRQERNATQAQLVKTLAAEAGWKTSHQLAERRLFDARITQSRLGRAGGRLGRRFDSLRAVAEAARLLETLELDQTAAMEVRNEAIAAMALVDLTADTRWPVYPAGSDVSGVAFDRQLQHYAHVAAEGAIRIRSLADNRIVHEISGLEFPAQRRPDFRFRLRFSPDGRYLAAKGVAGLPTRLWRIDTQELILEVPAGGDWYYEDLDFSPDSLIFATGLTSGAIGLFRTDTGQRVREIGSGGYPLSVRFRPGGRELAVVRDQQLHMVNLETGESVSPQYKTSVLRGEWSPDGHLLATACNDHHVHVWHGSPLEHMQVIEGHQGIVITMCFSHDSSVLATFSADHTSRLWDPYTGHERLRTTGAVAGFDEAGKWLAVGSHGPDVGRWRVALPRECRAIRRAAMSGSVPGLSPDGRILALPGSSDVQLWDLSTARLLATLPAGRTLTAVFDPRNSALVTSGDRRILRWPVRYVPAGADGAARFVVSSPQTIDVPANEPPVAVFLGSDGKTVVGRDASTGSFVFNLEDPLNSWRTMRGNAIWNASVSPDGKWICTSEWNQFDAVLWQADLLHELMRLPGRSAQTAFSPDGRWLVVGGPTHYDFYSTADWTVSHQLTRPGTQVDRAPLAFSPDGQFVALLASPHTVKLIELDTWTELATLTPPEPIQPNWLGVGGNGRWLVICSQTVTHIWDLARLRQQLRTMDLDWSRAPLLNAAPDRVEVVLDLN